jgi:hypothetical protein
MAWMLAGCTVTEGGTVALQILDVDGEIEDNYAVDWDGGVTWTREVVCSISESSGEAGYHLDAVDRSQGDLTLALMVQAYDGPGDYDRDEFQPSPALSIDWTDPETGEAWHLGTDSGGRCAITISEPSLSGTLSCIEVAVFRDQERTDDSGSVAATWACGTLERESVNATRSRRSPVPIP